MSSGRAQGSAPHLEGAVSDTPILVKTGKISLSSWFMYNPSNAAAYIRFFDAVAAADVTLGTTTPDYVVGCDTLKTAHAGYSRPLQFTKGLVIGACTTAVGSGHTAPNVDIVMSLGLTT